MVRVANRRVDVQYITIIEQRMYRKVGHQEGSYESVPTTSSLKVASSMSGQPFMLPAVLGLWPTLGTHTVGTHSKYTNFAAHVGRGWAEPKRSFQAPWRRLNGSRYPDE